MRTKVGTGGGVFGVEPVAGADVGACLLVQMLQFQAEGRDVVLQHLDAGLMVVVFLLAGLVAEDFLLVLARLDTPVILSGR
jgi:hypothetical protein